MSSREMMEKVRRERDMMGTEDPKMEHQVTFVKLLQGKIQELLEKMQDEDITKDELQSIKKQFKLLHSKSQQLIILLQVLTKVNNEVAHARLDLEKALKTNKNVDVTQKRVNWLEARLLNFLFLSRAMCHLDYHEGLNVENKKLVAKDLKPSFVEQLTDDQKGRLLGKNGYMNDDTKEMLMITRDKIEKDVERIFAMTNTDDDDDYDDDDYDYYSSCGKEAEKLGEEKEELQDEARRLVKKLSQVSAVSMETNSVDDYWQSDHHRFEWTNFMQKLDHLSWHSLAIAYQDTFLKRGDNPFPSGLMRWKLDRDLSEGSAFSKKSVEKLEEKLISLYKAIEDATVNSIETSKESIPLRQPYSVRGQRNAKRNLLSSDGKTLPALKNAGIQEHYNERDNKLASRPVSVILPVVSKNKMKEYPRKPAVWCDLDKVDIPKHLSYIRGPKQSLKNVPTISRRKKTSQKTSRTQESHKSLRAVADTVSVVTKLTSSLQSVSATEHPPDDLKWNRIQDLLSETGIQSCREETVIDAIKALSRLGNTDKQIIDSMRELIEKEASEHVIYEGCKCLITLGKWDPKAVKVLRKGLQKGNADLKFDVLATINSAKNSHYVPKRNPEISKLIGVLAELTTSEDKDIAFEVSLALGHLCVVDLNARSHLYGRLQDPSFAIRAKALWTLVRQMNCKDSIVINALLHQIGNSRNWKHRVAAAELLQFIGVKDVTAEDPEKVFDTLEKLLWNHPSAELRTKIAEVVNDFGMRPKAIFLVFKRLDNLEESIRRNGIQMLTSLRMKGERELKTLLDVVELDSSIYVRIQAIRAFEILKWVDPRVIRSLQEREKGDGVLAKEAGEVLAKLQLAAV